MAKILIRKKTQKRCVRLHFSFVLKTFLSVIAVFIKKKVFKSILYGKKKKLKQLS